MSKIETGGPAFPVDNVIARDDIGHLVGIEISSAGMTMRDYFAAKAMQGLLSGQWPDATDSKEIVRRSFVLADLMLKARK